MRINNNQPGSDHRVASFYLAYLSVSGYILSMLLKTLLDIVSPQLFASEFVDTDKITTVGDSVVCAFNNIGPFRIQAVGVVSCNLQTSALKAGSIIDIKAATRSGSTSWSVLYRESVGAIVRRFKNILPVGMSDQASINQIAEAALKRRKIFNACVCKSRPLSELPGGLALRTGEHLGVLASVGGASFLNQNDMRNLSNMLSVQLPSCPAILIPYFSSATTLSCLEFIYGKRGSENTTVWIDDSSIAFSNMLSMTPGNSYFLETQLSDLVSDLNQSQEESTSFFSVRNNDSGDTVPPSWLPKNFYFVRRTDNPIELLTPASLVRMGCSCVVTPYPSVASIRITGALSWEASVVESILRIVSEKDELTPVATTLLATVRTDQNVKHLLKTSLERMGKFVLSDELDRQLRTGTIWSDKSGYLYSTQKGYMWCDNNTRSLIDSQVTNFSLEPTHSVRYENGDVFRGVNVILNNDSRSILLPPNSLDTTKKLGESIADALSFCGNAPDTLPTIYDHVLARPILIWLLRTYSDMPVHSGVSVLGWNATRTRFTGAGFTSQEDGVTRTACCYRPNTDYLRYFASETGQVERISIRGDNPLKDVVLYAAAIILRSYYGYPVFPIGYSNDKETRDTLQRMFGYAGQLRAVQLNKNMRAMGELDCLQGYPFLAMGYNQNQALACKCGFILLGETGSEMHNCSDEDIKQGGLFLRYILEAVPTYLIHNCGATSFTPASDRIPASMFKEEGRRIIEEIENNEL